jgi:acetate kinase
MAHRPRNVRTVILVLNSGSSTIKYRAVDPAEPEAGRRGVVERIGTDVPDHDAAVRQVFTDLHVDGSALDAVGHRVVHGGSLFTRPTLIDDDVLRAIRDLVVLAPLHNPGAIAGIEAARTAMPGLPHVAVFDTAFHAGLPAVAATYAIDVTVARKHGIRRYGFHGISHRYVAGRTARLLDRPLDQLNLIVLHLGNGASATAVHSGRSVDTSMGFTPLEGLVMGTRSGDLDPAILSHLQRVAGFSVADVDELLQQHSGLAGLCNESDMRGVLAAREAGDERAALAVAVYCYRIRKYIGAYHAILGRLDAIAFTAGVGEHAAPIRAESLAGLDPWGISVDPASNASGAAARVISPPDARVAVCVVPTDEEFAIAEDVARLVGAG